MLLTLAGRRHAVLSGLCLIEDGVARTAGATTLVEFRAFDERLVAWYLVSGEWRERAGGYAIQGRGAALVERIEGDYLNVVGLPVSALLELSPALLPAFSSDFRATRRSGRAPSADVCSIHSRAGWSGQPGRGPP